MIKQMGQRDVGRLEKCADRNLIKFSKGKYKVLNLGRNNPMHQEKLWTKCLGSSLAAEQHLGMVADTRLSVSQQHALATRNASSLLGCTGKSTVSRSRKVIIPLIQPW